MGRNHYYVPRPPRNMRRRAWIPGVYRPPRFNNIDQAYIANMPRRAAQAQWDIAANRAIAEIHYQQQRGNLGAIPEATVRRMGDDIASYKMALKYQAKKPRKPMAEVMLESAQELQAEKMAEIHRK